MNGKTAFIYCRVSTTDQRNSIENQERLLKEFCASNSIEVKGVFTDFGKSGKDTKGRPEFTRMMNIIRNSEITPVTTVLTTKLDRFARSVVDLHINLGILSEKGIEFSTLAQSFDILTPTGKFFMSILGAVAEFEREINNERTREGYYAAKAKGKICNRPKIEINKKKVLELILDKGLSAHAASKIMNPPVTVGTIKNRMNEWGYFYTSGEWVKGCPE